MRGGGAFVFLGPTLPRADAATLCRAALLPPVRMGDIHRLVVAHRPRLIGIVDGLFEQTPAVWHKEILFALSQGVRVLGASSMGALRAAELHAFGMEGVGEIFAAFADGRLTDDDEVAVVHGSADDGWRPLSDAMVNLRLGLRIAAERGLIAAESRAALEAAAKRRFYPERTWAALLADGRALGLPAVELAALRVYVAQERPDQKRDDARALLARVAELDRAQPPARPDFDFEPTLFWLRLVETASPVAGEQASGATREQLCHHVRLSDPERRDLTRGALFLSLVEREARRQGVRVDRATAVKRFRRLHRLHSTVALSRWMEANRMTQAECAELMELDALCDELAARHAGAVDRFLVRELQRRGRLGDVVRELGDKLAFLARRGLHRPTPADLDADLPAVLSWYQQRHAVADPDIERHAAELGFPSGRSFLSELLAQYAWETRG
jgi:hypothetical protein